MALPNSRDPLLWRFSLYGFLKNQQYYEPFFLLVLRGKGLSFFQIGLLYTFREICVNLMGIPAGFLADMYGRRRALLVCFAAYSVAFLGFALGNGLPLLFAAMFAFAVGESFRSGTHKAMIFQHLRQTGQEGEKARVYGFTRSWSKAGSALSSLLSGVLVFLTGTFSSIFLFAIPPYLLNMVNVGTYPKHLEGEANHAGFSLRTAAKTMWRETIACVRNVGLRGLFIESAALQSLSKVVKDYLQPLLVASMVAWTVSGPLASIDATRRSAFLLGLAYFVLNLIAAWASRSSHRFDAIERRRFPWLWAAVALVGILVAVGSGLRGVIPGATGVAIAGFFLLVLIENSWRPLFLDRLDEFSDPRYGAAVLSVEAQFSSFGVMLCAPLVGKIADMFAVFGVGVFVVALAIATGIHSVRRKALRG
jgi:MFS family permease